MIIDQTNINQIKSIIKLSYLRCFSRCLARHITLSLIRQLSKHPNKNNTNLRCSSLCLASSELPPPSPSSTSTPPSSSQQPSGDPPLLFCYQADPLFSLPFILSVSPSFKYLMVLQEPGSGHLLPGGKDRRHLCPPPRQPQGGMSPINIARGTMDPGY